MCKLQGLNTTSRWTNRSHACWEARTHTRRENQRIGIVGRAAWVSESSGFGRDQGLGQRDELRAERTKVAVSFGHLGSVTFS